MKLEINNENKANLIADISNEDAIEVAKILGWWVDFTKYSDEEFDEKYGGGKECPMDMETFVSEFEYAFNESTDIPGKEWIKIIKFLRSRSYLVP